MFKLFFYTSLVLLVSYILTVLNIPIIRFFEGYPWLPYPWGKFLRHLKMQRITYLKNQISKLDRDVDMWTKRAEQSSDAIDTARARVEARDCELQLYLYMAELSWRYPQHQTWRVLPTSLGNVIAAAEEYPGHLYGMNSVTLWPFLSPILDKEGYAPFIEREKATLDFLLNMAVVTLIFGAELIYTDLLLTQLRLTWTDFWFICLKFVITVIIAYCFYLLSIQGALSWGFTIRTAFSLYRHHLRKRLGLYTPEDFYDEKNMWEDVSKFYWEQDDTPGMSIFHYSPVDEVEAPPTSPS